MKLSSSTTFFEKYLQLPLLVPFVGYLVGPRLLETIGGDLMLAVLVGLFMIILGAIGLLVWFWAFGQIKKVEVIGYSLVISNYINTIKVPLHEVVMVTGTGIFRPDLVWVRFRRPTIFGNEIVFRPRRRIVPSWAEHPTVALLQRLVRNAQQYEQ